MSQRRGDEENRPGGSGGSAGTLRPLWRAMGTAIPVVLTMLLAVFLAMQEEVLVAGRWEVATATEGSPLPTMTVLVAPATCTAVPPTATATSTPVDEPTSTTTPTRKTPRPTVAPPSCVKRRDWVSYTIRPGDTLSSIARSCGVSVQALKDGNCLKSNRIYAGGTMLVPWLPTTEPTRRPTPRPRPTRTSSRTPRPTATSSGTPSPTATEVPTSEPGTSTPTTVPPVPTEKPTNTAQPPTSTTTPVPPTATPVPTETSPPPTNTSAPPTATPSG